MVTAIVFKSAILLYVLINIININLYTLIRTNFV